MMPMTRTLSIAATWCAIALGFAIPISTAATNLLLAAILLLFAVSGDYRAKLAAIARNQPALAVLLFCAVVVLGSAYGSGGAEDNLHYLGKYLSLLLIPLLVPLFSCRADRVRALAAFGAAMLLTLALSYAIRYGWLPHGLLAFVDERSQAMWGADNPVVFKLHITQGFLMAFSAFLLAVVASQPGPPALRWAALLFSVLAAGNVLLMLKGRTGYAVLAVLGVLMLFERFGRRAIVISVLVIALVGAAAYQWSGSFHERVHLTIAEAGAWQPGKGDQTSIGLRFDYYTNTLAIIQDHPWFGVGTGGFQGAYGERIKNTGMAPSNNPHNQYLLIAAQLGVAGLAVLLWMYAVYWRQAGRLEPAFRQIARGVLLAMLVGNLFNSFMLDFTERLFFAWISGVLLAELSALHETVNSVSKSSVTRKRAEDSAVSTARRS